MRAFAAGALASVTALISQAALADEGGVSFWIPGFFGSLAAGVCLSLVFSFVWFSSH
jgi:hypothetical protein